MSNIKYLVNCDLDTSIILEIDTTKLTPAFAKEVNGFWANADNLIKASGGDVTQAVVRRAAINLLHHLSAGCSRREAVQALAMQEGWWPADRMGITIIDYELPDLCPFSLSIKLL